MGTPPSPHRRLWHVVVVFINTLIVFSTTFGRCFSRSFLRALRTAPPSPACRHRKGGAAPPIDALPPVAVACTALAIVALPHVPLNPTALCGRGCSALSAVAFMIADWTILSGFVGASTRRIDDVAILVAPSLWVRSCGVATRTIGPDMASARRVSIRHRVRCSGGSSRWFRRQANPRSKPRRHQVLFSDGCIFIRLIPGIFCVVPRHGCDRFVDAKMVDAEALPEALSYAKRTTKSQNRRAAANERPFDHATVYRRPSKAQRRAFSSSLRRSATRGLVFGQGGYLLWQQLEVPTRAVAHRPCS